MNETRDRAAFHISGLLWFQSLSLLQQALFDRNEGSRGGAHVMEDEGWRRSEQALPQIMANLALAQAAIGLQMGSSSDRQMISLEDYEHGMHACLDLADWCANRETLSVRRGQASGLWREIKRVADLLGGMCLQAAQELKEGRGGGASRLRAGDVVTKE